MIEFHLGSVTGPDKKRRSRPLKLTLEELNEHMLILGRTGSGKSRLLNQIVREHLRNRVALVLIDPDSDLVEDVLAFVTRDDMETGTRRLLRRVHVLEPSPFQSFAYDPFHFHLPRPVHPELLPSVRAAWLHCKVNRVAEILQRNNGQVDFEGMPRLQRVLSDVLYAVGTLVDGRHLPMADAAVLLDVHSDAGQAVYRRVERLLPREVRMDFETLAQMRRVEDLRKETESTVNRLRSIFGPLLQSVFSPDGTRPCFNLFDAIQRGELVLVSLRSTPYFSGDQAKAVANLLIYDTMTTAMMAARGGRKPVTLVIDEAAEYVTPDLSTMFRRGRKYLLSLILAAQSLHSFKKETLDLRPIVLGGPRSIVSMNQRYPDDLDLLARVLFQGELDYTPLTHEVERDGGTEFITLEEHSYSNQSASNWGRQKGWQRGRTATNTAGDSVTETKGWQKTRSEQEQVGDSRVHSSSRGQSNSAGHSESPRIDDGRVIDLLRLASEQQSSQRGESDGTAETHSFTTGTSSARSGGTSRGTQRSAALGASAGESGSDSEGGSESSGHSVAYRHAQVRKVVRELQRTGQLETSVADQLMRFATKLFKLRRRQAVVLMGTEAVEMEAADVPDPFCTQNAIAVAAEAAKRRLVELRPYLFVPDLTPAESERRLTEFLGEVADAVERVEADAVKEDDPFV